MLTDKQIQEWWLVSSTMTPIPNPVLTLVVSIWLNQLYNSFR